MTREDLIARLTARGVTVQYEHPTLGDGYIILDADDWRGILDALDAAKRDEHGGDA